MRGYEPMGPKKTLRVPLRVVFYREDNDWIAHCLEFDLIGDGSSKREALESLSEAIVLQFKASLEYNNPKNLFSPADGKYLEMFAAGTNVANGILEIETIERRLRDASDIIENIDAREYDEADSELTTV